MQLSWKGQTFEVDLERYTHAQLPGTRVSIFAPRETNIPVFDRTEWIADLQLPRSTTFFEARAATAQEALDRLSAMLPERGFFTSGGEC